MSRKEHRFAAVLILLFILGGCAAHKSQIRMVNRSLLEPDFQAQVTIVYPSELDWDARLTAILVRDALPRVTQWGRLSEPVRITIHPTHADLERAAERKGYDWLRAWARYNTIDLQAPSTWPGGNLSDVLGELITHELTHVVMYQTIGTKKDWYKKNIPMWFREGMASYVAGQAHRRMSREEIRGYYLGGGSDGDLLIEAERLAKHQSTYVYSAAHWAFADLLEEAGRERIVALLYLIRDGYGFREAFREVMPFHVETYLARWHDQLISVGAAGN